MINSLYKYISKITGIDEVYIFLILSTTIVIILFIFLKKHVETTIKRKVQLQNQFGVNQTVQIILSVIQAILLFFIWDEYIKNLATLFSVIGASTMIVLKEVVLSFWAGLYIRVKKQIVAGDRIEIGGIKGDVMNISTLDFDVLEISNDIENGQSTGVIITFPNSTVFTKEIKNITKGFKYVWNELKVKIKLDSDLVTNKKEIYRIVNNIDHVKHIVNKMKDQSNVVGTNNNIYFSKYDPIIYTKIVDSHVELTIRYLMDPRKSRGVESIIWNKIYEGYKNNIINLHIE